ncbi:MAG: TonB-dependent receptor [Bacteroidaceae bacterium]|nr:TonB-dependent receptor [Bacteroidaceae bacterium]
MLNRFFFINCFFFLFASLVSAATIRGTVISNRERLPVAYATLLLKGTDIGAITNEKGEFSFPSLLPGSYRFIVSAVGYVPLETPEYLLRTKDVSITIELEESIEQLAEVVVSANPYDHLAKNPISVHAIGIQEIEKSPGANRDISKIIQAYPGVSYSAVGYRNDLMVRGGGPSENKFYLDGIEIPSINHFSTQGATGGVSGIINADLLRDVQFYSADFPANAGNAVSSVLQFNLKDGTVDGTNYKGTLGASEVSFVTSGHFSEKSTYICSVRRSYLQFLFKLLDLPFLPTYSDAQFKWKHRFNSKNELTLLGLVGIDDLKINDDASSERALYTIGYIPEIQQQAFTIGAKYKFYAPHSIRSVIASYSFLNNKSEKYKDNNREQADLLRLKYSSQERKAQLRIENKTTLRNWTLMYGGEANYFSYDMESKQQLFFDTTPVMQIYATDLSYLNWGTYFSLLYATPQNKINVSFALRADACSYNSYMRNPLHQLSPRFKFSYLINRHVTASVNMGIYNQRPPATALGFKDNAGVYLNKDLTRWRN